ncbi:MAG: hypothetical protein ACRC6O_08105 [Flavobacterium sp.]
MQFFYRFLLFIVFLCVFTGCTSFKNKLIPTANQGGYTVYGVRSKSKIKSDEVTIHGTVFDVKTGKPLTPPVQLTIGCFKIQTSSQGEYSFKTQNFKDDYFFIEVISVGYRTIETNFIDIYNKNEVQIDFYLSEDDRPLIDCIPVPAKVFNR